MADEGEQGQFLLWLVIPFPELCPHKLPVRYPLVCCPLLMLPALFQILKLISGQPAMISGYGDITQALLIL